MRIPDEKYYSDGQNKKEDTKGFQFCPHCDKCMITDQNQIFKDGMFFCLHLKKWKRGDDMLEYMCEGYVVKECDTCSAILCKDRGTVLYCNKYKNKDVRHHGAYFFGRRNVMKNTDPFAIRVEEMYIEHKRRQIDNQRDGSDEAGEREQVQEGNEVLGNLSVSYADKEGEVRFPFEKED